MLIVSIARGLRRWVRLHVALLGLSMIWWKEYELDSEAWARWRIGPLELFACAASREWVFAWRAAGGSLDETALAEIPAPAPPEGGGFTFSRYATRFSRAALRLSPRLADRAFVVRSELPLFLPAGENVTLYVSSPVWVRGVLGDEGTPLFEVPSFRASDTWFGRNTCEGELCYSARTRARTDLDKLSAHPHRAVTPLEIRNTGADVLPIEQLRVPLPALSLYEVSGRLWTDTVSLIRKDDQSSAAMSVSDARRHHGEGHLLLCGPRRTIESGTIISVFSRLLN